MVGGEVTLSPEKGAGQAQCDAQAQSISTDVTSAGSSGAGEASSAQVSESAPQDFYGIESQQSIWDPKAKSKGSSKVFDGAISDTVVNALNPSAAEPVGIKDYIAEKVKVLEGAEKQAFERLFVDNVGIVEGEKVSRAKLDGAYENALDQFSSIRSTALVNGMPVEKLPDIVEAGLAEGYSGKEIAEEFKNSRKPETRKKLSAKIKEALTREGTLEKVAELAEKTALDATKAKEPFRARAKSALAGAAKGGAVWYASLELADALGIENPSLHFAFVIYSMETEMVVEETARGMHAAVKAGATVGEAWKATPVMRAIAGETLGARLMNLTKRTFVNPQGRLINHLGPGLLASKFGYAATMAVGTIFNLDEEKVAEAVPIVSTGAFLAPDIIRGMAGASAEVGGAYAVAGWLAVLTMVVDMGVDGIYQLADDNYGYNVSLEARAADRYKEEMMERQFDAAADMTIGGGTSYLVGGAVGRTLEDFAEIFMPNAVRRARALAYHKMKGHDLDETLGGEEFWTKDYDNSKKVRAELPDKLGAILVEGFDGQHQSADFYKGVDLGWLGEELDPEDNLAARSFDEALEEYRESPNYKALKRLPKEKRPEIIKNYLLSQLGSEEVYQEAAAFKAAAAVQGELKALHMMDLLDKDPIRELVTEDGAIIEGKEDEFLMEYVSSAIGDLPADATADDVRARIVEERKVSLVNRILTAEAEGMSAERDELMDLAAEIGLVDDEGNLANGEIYGKAVASLARTSIFKSDERIEATLASHSERLFRERMELAGKPSLTDDDRARLKQLNAMDLSLRATVMGETSQYNDAMRMAQARGIAALFVDRQIDFAKFSEDIEALGLTPEQRAEIDKFKDTLFAEKIHQSMPKPKPTCTTLGCGK